MFNEDPGMGMGVGFLHNRNLEGLLHSKLCFTSMEAVLLNQSIFRDSET